MKRISEKEIEEIVTKFSDKSLPISAWTHQAHLMVGLWHNMNYDFETALNLVRTKIINYNTAVGTPNTDDSGYHETITIFWMKLTQFFLSKHRSKNIEDIYNDFIKSEYASKNYLFKFYSKETLFSKAARKKWVDGDRGTISFL